jgi:hypothetical protein
MSKLTNLEKIMLQFLLKYEKMDKKERQVLIDILMKMTHPTTIINPTKMGREEMSLCNQYGHIWTYAGDPNYFPYEGMNCDCGLVKYHKLKEEKMKNRTTMILEDEVLYPAEILMSSSGRIFVRVGGNFCELEPKKTPESIFTTKCDKEKPLKN